MLYETQVAIWIFSIKLVLEKYIHLLEYLDLTLSRSNSLNITLEISKQSLRLHFTHVSTRSDH